MEDASRTIKRTLSFEEYRWKGVGKSSVESILCTNRRSQVPGAADMSESVAVQDILRRGANASGIGNCTA
jgi:hypothetical protein